MLQTTTDAQPESPVPAALMVSAAYRSTSTAVAPQTAIVMALDRVLLNLKRAANASEKKKFDEVFSNVSHSAQILRGLSQHLDVEKGGALAERLRAVYNRHVMAMYFSVGKPDAVRRFNILAEGLGELRDAWAVVAKRPLRGTAATEQSAQ
jgi:flagellar protein FliS